MKTKYVLLLITMLSISCTDLDEKLYDKVPLDEYGGAPSEMQTIIGNAYATLRGFNDASQGGTQCYPAGEFVLFLSECVSDEVTIPTRGADWYDGGRYQQAQRHLWDANNMLILSTWKYSFQGIANINAIIFQIEQIDLSDESKKALIAELRGIRAYYYYQLLDQFGSVPIVTDFKQEGLPEQSSRIEVYKFVESELKDITELLSPNIIYSRFTQNVAHSILARLYLNSEVYTGESRWKECIDACNKVSGYILEPDYFENFKTKNEKSREIIFAIPYDHKQGTKGNYIHSLTLDASHKWAISPTGTYPWSISGICAQPGLYSSYEDKDARRASLLIGPQYNMTTGELIKMSSGQPLIYTEEIQNFTNALHNEGARLAKYEILGDEQWERDHDFVLIRWAEILMMQAEANFRMGKTSEALVFVNTIRARAGLDNLTTLTEESLDQEWKHEFVFEGLRRTTNIRFGTFFKPWWEKGETPKYRGLYPIPQNVLDLNPSLKQNPDYM